MASKALTIDTPAHLYHIHFDCREDEKGHAVLDSETFQVVDGEEIKIIRWIEGDLGYPIAFETINGDIVDL